MYYTRIYDEVMISLWFVCLLKEVTRKLCVNKLIFIVFFRNKTVERVLDVDVVVSLFVLT